MGVRHTLNVGDQKQHILRPPAAPCLFCPDVQFFGLDFSGEGLGGGAGGILLASRTHNIMKGQTESQHVSLSPFDFNDL